MISESISSTRRPPVGRDPDAALLSICFKATSGLHRCIEVMASLDGLPPDGPDLDNTSGQLEQVVDLADVSRALAVEAGAIPANTVGGIEAKLNLHDVFVLMLPLSVDLSSDIMESIKTDLRRLKVLGLPIPPVLKRIANFWRR